MCDELTSRLVCAWLVQLPEIDLEADRVPKVLLQALTVQPEHVRKALTLTNPSTLRETAIEVPNVKWEVSEKRRLRTQPTRSVRLQQDIGGLEDVKRELKETVQYPVQCMLSLRSLLKARASPRSDPFLCNTSLMRLLPCIYCAAGEQTRTGLSYLG